MQSIVTPEVSISSRLLHGRYIGFSHKRIAIQTVHSASFSWNATPKLLQMPQLLSNVILYLQKRGCDGEYAEYRQSPFREPIMIY